MYIEEYIREVIREEVNYNTRNAITEILTHNNYDEYNKLDENLKLKVKNILQKAVIFGVAGMSGLGGYASSGRSATDDGRNLVSNVLNVINSQSAEEIINTSIKALTTGKFSVNKSLPQNIKKQLAIIMTHRNPQQDGKFIVVDDQNKLLYLFSKEGKVTFKTPIITGRDLDINLNKNISFANWLSKNGHEEEYKKVRNSKSRKGKKEEKKLFFGYLSHVDEENQKITGTGVYSITAIKQVGKDNYDQDKVAYGKVGKVSITPGMDSPLSSGSGIAIHGTGIKGRMRAFNKAIRYMTKKGERANPAYIKKILSGVNSYGCINVKDSKLKILISKIDKETTIYVMSDSGDGVVQFSSKNLENAFAMLDFFVKKTGRSLAKAQGLYQRYVGQQEELKVSKGKFKLK